MSVAPVMLQYWFRKETQIPLYLRGVEPRDDLLGYDLMAAPGEMLIEKTQDEAIDTSHLHQELLVSGLVLTHASRVDRTFVPIDSPSERFYYVLRFHYFPAHTAVVHEGVEVEKLVEALDEINQMAFWGVRADLNTGKYGQWVSVSCRGRVQRYTGEDLTRPEMRNLYNELGEKIGSAPVAASRALHYLGENRLTLSVPAMVG